MKTLFKEIELNEAIDIILYEYQKIIKSYIDKNLIFDVLAHKEIYRKIKYLKNFCEAENDKSES